ncbi:transglycosylase domain-containing protein [Patescibacteria group bacterium]|nr:transglycosylase domain-containing protein [Patescibacteria group bacterium]
MIKKQPNLPKKWSRRKIKNFGWRRWWWQLVLLVGLSGLLFGVIMFAWISRDLPSPEGIARRVVSQSTKIYDRTGQKVLYDIHGTERRTSIELKDIPDYLKQATLTAEDRNFYEHQGFRFTSLVRSVLVNLIRGRRAQGGSTITQQFIKNAVLTNEKSYIRKIKELVLAYQIEQRFSKDQILKLYLNEIPYGSTAYGVEAASEMVFGKKSRDLNLAESVLLASLPQSPTYYSPWGSHVDELIKRQHYILDNMVEQGYITTQASQEAKKTTLDFKPRRESIIAPHFVFFVKEQLARIYGEKTVEQGGLKIITTLDLDKQTAAEAAITEAKAKNTPYNAHNASLVALDATTNQILAMVGSTDYFEDSIQGQVNVSIRPRQPGSSFKPIVYALAFEQGFTPNSLLYDVQTIFKSEPKDYAPNNYDGQERGPINLRSALAGSLNIPAVKLLYLTGLNNVLKLSQDLGYTTLNDQARFGLSLVLGGAEVSLLEHTSAYASFAREGITKPINYIIKIEDANGDTLQEFKDSPGTRVLSVEATRTLSNILSDNPARSYIFGEQNHLTLPDRLVAAKTGTTNNYHDAWTMGYTSNLAVGVWVGNSNNQAMKKGADGSVVAAPIWQNFFKKISPSLPIIPFNEPLPTSPNKPMLNGSLGGQTVIIDKISGNLATEFTPAEFKQTKTFSEHHTILKYLSPGNPLGPIPQDPSLDPQYQNWEEAVKLWAQKNNQTNSVAPTIYDNIHNPDSQPTLTAPTLKEGQTITSLPWLIPVTTSAKNNIKSVDYYLDDILINSNPQPPFSLLVNQLPFNQGAHRLKIISRDVFENSTTIEHIIKLDLPTNILSNHSSIISPTEKNLYLSDQPIELKINSSRPENLKQIDIYSSLNNSSPQWFGVITNIQPTSSFFWSPKETGQYKLFITASEKNSPQQSTSTTNYYLL